MSEIPPPNEPPQPPAATAPDPAVPLAVSSAVPPVPSAPQKLGNPIGLAALIVGIVAFLFGVIPFLSFIAWLPAVVAIGLGIAGLVVKNRKRAAAAIGLVLGILAIIVGIIVSLVGIATVASSVNESIEQEEQAASEVVTLVYEVTSDAATANNITYSSFGTGSDGGSSQANDAPLPWTVSEDVERGGTFDFNSYSLLAQAADGATTITCKITLDGQVISENTSTGQFAIATCSASSSDLDD